MEYDSHMQGTGAESPQSHFPMLTLHVRLNIPIFKYSVCVLSHHSEKVFTEIEAKDENENF